MAEHKRSGRGVWVVAVIALAAAIGGAAVGAWWSRGLPGAPAMASDAGGDAEPAAGAASPEDAGSPPPGPPPADVRLAEADTRLLQDRVEVIGRLREVRRAVVASEVSGKVLELPVDEGDRVTGGQTVLARIDDVWASLALAEARAQVEAARATLDQSERDLAQLEQLASAQSARPKEVEDARAQVAADRAELQAREAARSRAAQEVERLRVLAPFDGVVVEKHTEVGQWVEPGSPVVEVISRGTIDAVVNIPEAHVNAVDLGDRVEVLVEPLRRELMGEVVSVTPLGASAARTFPVKLRLDDQDGALKPGMSVVARVPIERQRDRLTVPRDAVNFSPSGATVWVAAPGNGPMPTATPVAVDVLFGQGDRYAVVPRPGAGGDPLAAGTLVVIEGAERLFPGRPLAAVGGPSAAPGDAEASAAPPPAGG